MHSFMDGIDSHFDGMEFTSINEEINPYADLPKRQRVDWPVKGRGKSTVLKEECPAICAVCGKKAIGYNYNVASCNGCKSFFRRTVQHNRRFVCEQPEKCRNLGKEKRMRCRSCRFAHCIEAGMNVRAVGATKALAHTDEGPSSESSEPSPSAVVLIPTPKPIENVMDRLIEEMLYLEASHQKLRRSQYNPSFPPPQSVEWCILGPSRMGIDFGEMPAPYPPHPSPIPFVSFEDRIRHRINIDIPVDRPLLPPTYKQWITVDLAYTVEWLKTLSFFPMLRECEKSKLAQNVTQAVAYLTASFDSYDRINSDVTIFPDGTMLCTKPVKESSIAYSKWFGIISRMKAIKMDKKEYVLIKSIIACDPDDDFFCAETRNILQRQREKYAKSLSSYVMASRGPDKGPYAYSQMLSLINWQKGAIMKLKNAYLLLSALKLRTFFHTKFLDEFHST